MHVDENVLFILAGKIPDDLRRQVTNPARLAEHLRIFTRHHKLRICIVRMVRDLTGRFPERPHYTGEELDRDASGWSRTCSESGMAKSGNGSPPTTPLLIKQNGASLDSSVDLRQFGR